MRKYFRNTVSFILMIVAVAFLAVIISYIILYSSFDTEYSNDFNIDSWNNVRIGMSELEVKSMIGEPLSVDQWKSGETLNYSRSRSNNSNYMHLYIVIQDEKVIEKRKEIFWD